MVSFILAVVLLLVACRQVLTTGFLWFAWKPGPERIPDEDLLPALVLLPLRGADALLAEGLKGLFDQDYPNYRVRIIIDHPEDPSRQVVEDVLAASCSTNVEVMFLANPAETCSPRCSALYEATAQLPEDCGVVVTIDADVIAHRTWLRELVSPLKDPRVGAAMGNRWYSPSTNRLGSWIRYVWNAAAVVSMHYVGIPWGGALAYRAHFLEDTGWRERWLHAAAEDVTLPAALRRAGLKLQFVPSAISINREEISFRGCLDFVCRQLIWTRLHYPFGWWTTAFVFFLLTMLQIIVLGFGLSAAIQGQWDHALLLGLVEAGYLSIQVLQLAMLERNVQRFFALRGEQGTSWRAVTVLAAFAAQLLSIPIVWASLTTRRLNWRGIDYALGGTPRVRMLKYQPMHQHPAHGKPEDRPISL